MEKISKLEKLTPKSEYLAKGTAKIQDKQISYIMRCQCGQYMGGHITNNQRNELLACLRCDEKYNIVPKLEISLLE